MCFKLFISLLIVFEILRFAQDDTEDEAAKIRYFRLTSNSYALKKTSRTFLLIASNSSCCEIPLISAMR